MTSDHFGLSESILDPSLVVENSDESQVASTKESVQFITKIDRMKTRQGESLFLKVDVNGETCACSAARNDWRGVWKRAVTTAGERNRSWNETPSSLLVELGQSSSGYKVIEAFLPEAGA